MHATLFSVLNDPNNINNIPKELELATSIHKKEMEELHTHYNEIINTLERQITDSKTNCDNLEIKIRNLQAEIDETNKTHISKNEEYEQKLKECEEKINKANENNKKLKEAMELDSHVKISNLNGQIEKIKIENSKEILEMKQKCENSLNDIKNIYQQEKSSLEERIQKLSEELKNSISSKENSQIINEYIEEIQELNNTILSLKKQNAEQISSITKEKDELTKKIKEQNSDLFRIRDELAQTKHRLKQIESEPIIEGTQADLKKAKKQITEMKSHISKLESDGRRLKSLLTNKETAFEQEKENLKRKYSLERKKASQAHDGYSRAKDENDKKLSQLLQDVLEKDKQICLLNKQIENMQKDEKKNIKHFIETPAKQQNLQNDPEEIKLVLSANRFECKKCMSLIPASEFSEHIKKECDNINSERIGTVGNEGEAMAVILSESMKEKNKFNSAGPGIVVSASCSGNKNEIILQKKLKMTEEILKEMAFKLDTVQQQRDKVQIELDKANAELLSIKIRTSEDFSQFYAKFNNEHSHCKEKPVLIQSKENLPSETTQKSMDKPRQLRSTSTLQNPNGTPLTNKASNKKVPTPHRNSNCVATITGSTLHERKNSTSKKMCFSPNGMHSKRNSRPSVPDEEANFISPGDDKKHIPRSSIQHVNNFQ